MADRLSVDRIYNFKGCIGSDLEYKAMSTWSNRDVVDWACFHEMHIHNRDIVDVFRDRIHDPKEKKEIQISGYHLLKFTVNLKLGDAKVKQLKEYSWRDLLYNEDDVEYLAQKVRQHLAMELSRQGSKERRKVIKKMRQYNAKRTQALNSKGSILSSIFGIFFATCGQSRGQTSSQAHVLDEDGSIVSGRLSQWTTENADSEFSSEDDDGSSDCDEDEDGGEDESECYGDEDSKAAAADPDADRCAAVGQDEKVDSK